MGGGALAYAIRKEVESQWRERAEETASDILSAVPDRRERWQEWADRRKEGTKNTLMYIYEQTGQFNRPPITQPTPVTSYPGSISEKVRDIESDLVDAERTRPETERVTAEAGDIPVEEMRDDDSPTVVPRDDLLRDEQRREDDFNRDIRDRASYMDSSSGVEWEDPLIRKKMLRKRKLRRKK